MGGPNAPRPPEDYAAASASFNRRPPAHKCDNIALADVAGR
jgi:hypothetical protein